MISNWDHRLFSIVEGLGLTSYFEQVFASSAVGVAKPGVGIFRRAVETLGIEPTRAMHLGDSLEDDYLGAKRAGLQAVLLDRSGRPPIMTSSRFIPFRIVALTIMIKTLTSCRPNRSLFSKTRFSVPTTTPWRPRAPAIPRR